jgi:hypothetical protein
MVNKPQLCPKLTASPTPELPKSSPTPLLIQHELVRTQHATIRILR